MDDSGSVCAWIRSGQGEKKMNDNFDDDMEDLQDAIDAVKTTLIVFGFLFVVGLVALVAL